MNAESTKAHADALVASNPNTFVFVNKVAKRSFWFVVGTNGQPNKFDHRPTLYTLEAVAEKLAVKGFEMMTLEAYALMVGFDAYARLNNL